MTAETIYIEPDPLPATEVQHSAETTVTLSLVITDVAAEPEEAIILPPRPPVSPDVIIDSRRIYLQAYYDRVATPTMGPYATTLLGKLGVAGINELFFSSLDNPALQPVTCWRKDRSTTTRFVIK